MRDPGSMIGFIQEMALIVGSNRTYGFDCEGGVTHEHPTKNPTSHVPSKERLEVEEFILNCLEFLKDKELL